MLAHAEMTWEKDGQTQAASFRSNLFEWQVIFRVELEGFHYKVSYLFWVKEKLNFSNAIVIMSSKAELF